MIRRALILSLSLLVCACSIREDRYACPCLLSADVEAFAKAGLGDLLVAVNTEEEGEDLELFDAVEGQFYEKNVPKGRNEVSFVAGLKNSIVGKSELRAAEGVECDPLWTHFEAADCSGEAFHLTASPRKHYCNMTLAVVGVSDDEEYSFIFSVSADCNGIGTYDGCPLEGEYLATATRGGNDAFELRLPRQDDNEDIWLEVSSWISRSGKVYVRKSFKLDVGRELERLGYDWSTPNLDDVAVVIDYSEMSLSLGIESWKEDDDYRDNEY